jgi:hypothetical protein
MQTRSRRLRRLTTDGAVQHCGDTFPSCAFVVCLVRYLDRRINSDLPRSFAQQKARFRGPSIVNHEIVNRQFGLLFNVGFPSSFDPLVFPFSRRRSVG